MKFRNEKGKVYLLSEFKEAVCTITPTEDKKLTIQAQKRG